MRRYHKITPIIHWPVFKQGNQGTTIQCMCGFDSGVLKNGRHQIHGSDIVIIISSRLNFPGPANQQRGAGTLHIYIPFAKWKGHAVV